MKRFKCLQNGTLIDLVRKLILVSFELKQDEDTIFGIVGTGGRELHKLDDQACFTANQLEEHGFLELKTNNNGKSLVGQFYSNDGNIIKDKFIIEKIIF
jgi:hypothetical protein